MGLRTSVAVTITFLFVPASLAQSASCSSYYPEACTSGAYDPGVVTGIVENAFSSSLAAICLPDCSARFQNWASSCEQIPDDPNGVAGTKARNICILLGEERYLECMGDCQFSSTP